MPFDPSLNGLRGTVKLPSDLRDGMMMMTKNLFDGVTLNVGIVARLLFRHGRMLEVGRIRNKRIDETPIDHLKNLLNTAFVEGIR